MDDLDVMLQRFDAEFELMGGRQFVSASFYVERAAILLRKAERFEQEVHMCESYVRAVNRYYADTGDTAGDDVREGPRFAAIQQRLLEARELLNRKGGAT